MQSIRSVYSRYNSAVLIVSRSKYCIYRSKINVKGCKAKDRGWYVTPRSRGYACFIVVCQNFMNCVHPYELTTEHKVIITYSLAAVHMLNQQSHAYV